jgi:hypothetical protein
VDCIGASYKALTTCPPDDKNCRKNLQSRQSAIITILEKIA